ncbi:hypothetical protein [Nocardia sp. NPDC057272]|uniref:hypothetical protein n=1 Tax=Nocardia sp. NPDC057272 TaxID=3346079 RepID=UPI00362615D4
MARRLVIDVALLHLSAVRFGLTGPVKYTMGARDATRVIRVPHPRITVAVNYEGWTPFQRK